MPRTTVTIALAVPLLFLAASLPTAAGPPPHAQERILERAFDDDGQLVWEKGLARDDDVIAFERFYRQPAKPDDPGNGKGGGNGGGGDDDGGAGDPGTDCASDRHVTTGYAWTGPYAATASSFVAELDTSGATWDAATGRAVFAGVTFGDTAVAGEFDGVDQMDWTFLGSGGTIAVTTTWYNRFTGEAVESDAQYNTYYPWATDGSAGAMDVQNIATHEIGHSLGLGHPNGPSHKIGCLTMYAYGDLEEVQKRTLGDGDIIGIRALYG